MGKIHINLLPLPHFHVPHFLFIAISLSFLSLPTRHSLVKAAPAAQEILKGFTAKPDPKEASFQPLLTDSTGNYSLGFLRVKQTQLALAVVHVPSSEPLWTANPTRLARWSDPTQLSFNGSLVISDPHTRVFWSTNTDGDRVGLSNTSNLEIESTGESSVLWQSFDFPSDTLVESQNFTSTMSLVSSNGLYSMRLGPDFMGLYAKFDEQSGSDQIYWLHRALEAKADIIVGQGPIYAVLEPDGFLGMYQNGSNPADVQAFNSFQQSGKGIRRVRVEPDGNLKGYFWTGSSWVLDYQAITDPCELPSPCGSYGLCQPGKGCSCIDNRTDYNSGGCDPPENKNSGDFCNSEGNNFWALRRNGVELPFKELMSYTKMGSLAQCEGSCALNCTCWGVVYNNNSGFCYTIYYPIQTLLGVGDETKMGYFKVREGAGKQKMRLGLGVGLGILCAGILICSGLVGLGWYMYYWRRNRGVSGYTEEEGTLRVGVGPYKDLGSASFRSIELCEK